jgi:hypothetical protein
MKLQNSALLETISLNERGGQSMSALPPKADIGTQSRDVRFVPKADIVTRLVTVTQMLTNDLHHPIG